MINNNTYYDDVLIRFLESTINNRGQTYTIGTTGGQTYTIDRKVFIRIIGIAGLS